MNSEVTMLPVLMSYIVLYSYGNHSGLSQGVHNGEVVGFNKICHPSQRPRWQVDKEAIGLSRVQQCSSIYNPPS